MWTNHPIKIISFLVVSILSLALSVFHVGGNTASSTANIEQHAQVTEAFKLSEQRRMHILVGDGTGGGHKAGAGKPGKTEFPENWDDNKIIAAITKIANDPTLPMRQSGKRYWLRMGEEDGLQIRVVLDRERGEIITGYPVKGHRN